MKSPLFEILGIAGITISMLANVPQVLHLGREHCSAGISRRAWTMWLLASLLVGALAIHRGDLVFIALQFSTLASAAVILYLAQKYRGMVCEAHQANPSRQLTATGGPPRPSRRSWPPKLSASSSSGTFKSSSRRARSRSTLRPRLTPRN